jgi:hypothetical protein
MPILVLGGGTNATKTIFYPIYLGDNDKMKKNSSAKTPAYPKFHLCERIFVQFCSWENKFQFWQRHHICY